MKTARVSNWRESGSLPRESPIVHGVQVFRVFWFID